MDDSISLSPTCGTESSINASKERRKRKRQSKKDTSAVDHESLTRSSPVELKDVNNVDRLNETFVVPVTENWLQTECHMFNPEADWLDCSQAQSKRCVNKKLLLTQGQGFVKLNEFILSQAEPADKSENCYPRSEVPCSMTNTELMDICNDVERNFETSTENDGKNETEGKKSIIEVIQHDFCSYPYYQEDWFNNANNPTPYFRFRDKVLLTYSRIRNVESIHDLEPNDDDCISNCSSGLSIQEDHTMQWSTNHPADFNPNTSDRLCQNLLNLSAFFTQNAKNEDADTIKGNPQIKYEKIDLDLSLETDPQTQQDDCTFDKDHHFEFRQSMPLIFIDYHWFLYEGEPEVTDCEFIVKHNFQDSLETQNKNDPSTIAGADCNLGSLNENDCNKVKKIENIELNGLNLSDEFCDHDDSFSKLINRPELNKIKNQENNSGLINDENLGAMKKSSLPKSQYYDEWNEDCDEFINYNTEDLLSKSVSPKHTHKTSPREYMGFCTASQKPISISESARKHAKYILNELPEIDGINDEILKNVDVDWYVRDAQAYKSKENNNDKPCTSKEALEQVTELKILKELDVRNINLNEWSPENTKNGCGNLESDFELNTSKNDNITSKEPEFVRFVTANQKNIAISNEAMKRAVHILSQLPDIPLEDIKDSKQKSILGTQDVLTKECKQIKKQMVDGKVVSAEFQNDIEQIKQLKGDKSKKCDIKLQNNYTTSVEEPEFVGFLTASQKSISISNEAMKKAAHILSELPEMPISELRKTEQYPTLNNRQEIPKEIQKHLLEKIDVVTSASKKFKSEMVLINQKHGKEDIPLNQDLPLQKDDTSNIKETEFVGFLTASKKNISISNEAMKRATKILSELPEIPSKDLKEPQQKPLTETEQGLTIGIEEIPKQTIENTFSESPVHVANLQKSSSFEIKTLQTPVSYGQLQSSLSELQKPVGSCKTASLISRKNLLTLSKRRKLKQSQSTKDTKSPSSRKELIESTEMTPKRNLNTFSNTLLATSTPRPIRSDNEPHISLSSDFQKINWDGINMDCSNLSQTSGNVTQINPNPSATERIERLSVYGDPSPISPIPINTRTTNRRLGLSRIRSSKRKN